MHSFEAEIDAQACNVSYQARAKRGGPKGPRARARALAKFTPIHHWEGGGTQIGPKTLLFGEMHFTPFLHDVGAKQLLGV